MTDDAWPKAPWPAVQKAIRGFPAFDAKALALRIKAERQRCLTRWTPLVPAEDHKAEQSGSAKLSPRELASKHGVDAGALRKRLDRWRYEHDAGYVEVSNAARNEPKYLYDESAVMPVIEALKAKPVGRKRAADGQQKKV